MTVYGSFDLEDDDFFDDTFRNITDAELSNLQTVTKAVTEDSSANKCSSHNNSMEIHLPEEEIQIDDTPTHNTIASNRKSVCMNPNAEDLKVNQPHTPVLNKNLENVVVNSRFTPGFSPKVRKRKFPGPAGIFLDCNEDDLQQINSESEKEKSEADKEMQITNSQYSTEDLLLPSWQTLQAEVSSNSSLSAAKYYSIRRVYHETSKKKLPKHIIVPLLCVLLKKFNQTEQHSIFIDDTGEISGKIEKPVLCSYGEYLKDGVALILKKVTFLCNVLVLTEESIASIYSGDGTVKHFQEVDLVPLKEEPLKPMSCPCSHVHTAKVAKNHVGDSFCKSAPVHSSCEHNTTLKTKNSNYVPHRNYQSSPKFATTSSTFSDFKSRPKKEETKISVSVPNKTLENAVSHSVTLDHRLGSYASPANGTSSSENPIPTGSPLQHNSANNVAVDTNDCFGGVSDFDEFDELLGNLDETSFMGEF